MMSTSHRRLRVCQECDLLTVLPALPAGAAADCPRCGHTLARHPHSPAQNSLALAVAALFAMGLAVSFPFVRFEISGVGNRIGLTETASSLLDFQQPLVALAVALTILVLPAIYLLGVVWLQLGLLRRAPLRGSRFIARSLSQLAPWMMADVFLVGALVSFIKMASDAQVALGMGFWAFCAYAVLLLATTHSLDAHWLWFALEGEPRPPAKARPGQGAAAQGLGGCPTCGLVNALDTSGKGTCQRCGERLRLRDKHGLQATWALLLAAAVLYLPANLYPMMSTTQLGSTMPATIVGGVLELWRHGYWFIATVIFLASIVVPLGKLLVLAWLSRSVGRGDIQGVARTRLYRLVEFIGRWSMVDVFVLAILVALVQQGALLSVTPGPAALAFAGVVALTMLAAIAFDPRRLWDDADTMVARHTCPPGHTGLS